MTSSEIHIDKGDRATAGRRNQTLCTCWIKRIIGRFTCGSKLLPRIFACREFLHAENYCMPRIFTRNKVDFSNSQKRDSSKIISWHH